MSMPDPSVPPADCQETSQNRAEGPLRGEITELLHAWGDGDEAAGNELMELVYTELRQIAAGHLAAEGREHTLQPTALVHEAYLRLSPARQLDWQNRKHFYALASRMVRRILVDYARQGRTLKRGGPVRVIPLEDVDEMTSYQPRMLLDLHNALNRLKDIDPEQSSIVEYRFFGGLTVDEIAEVVGCSSATVARRWRIARAWLYRELKSPPAQGQEASS